MAWARGDDLGVREAEWARAQGAERDQEARAFVWA